MRLILTITFALLLTACDIPGLGPDPRIAQREADGKAVGGGCRYAQRGIEECYELNPKSPKTAVFEGWKEMDQYMRENKLEGQPTPGDDSRAETGSKDSARKPATGAPEKSKISDRQRI